MITSEFEKIVPEDFNQYRNVAKRFQKVDMTNVDELNRLSIDSWVLACRWNNILSNSRKIADQHGISKTDFGDWSYHIYSLLKELHVTTRSWYNNAVKDYELNKIINGE